MSAVGVPADGRKLFGEDAKMVWRILSKIGLCAYAVALTALLAASGAAWAQDSAGDQPAGQAAASPTVADKAEDVAIERLIEVLKDDAARRKLVEALGGAQRALTPVEAEAAAAAGTVETPAASPDATPSDAVDPSIAASAPESLAEELERSTSRLAARGMATASRFIAALSGLSDIKLVPEKFELGSFVAAAWPLLAIMTVTFSIRLTLSHFAQPLYERLNDLRKTISIRWVRRMGVHIGATAIRAGIILLAYGVGVGMDIVLFGDGKTVDPTHSLYLNAFLVVGLSHAAARLLFAPKYAELRIFPMSERAASLSYRRSEIAIGLIVFGLLFLTPLLADAISDQFGRGFRALVLLGSTAFVVASIWTVREVMKADSAIAEIYVVDQASDLTSRILRYFGKFWAHGATLYAVGVFLTAVARPLNTMSFILEATAISLAAIALAMIISSLLGKALKPDFLIPNRYHGELPTLERRVARAAPRILNAARFVAMVCAVLAVCDAWGLLDVSSWLTFRDGAAVLGSIGMALATVVFGYLAWLGIGGYVEYRLSDRLGVAPTPRERTLLPLFFTAISIITVVMVAMIALSELGFNIAPLLAGAGVVGLAVGFGAQTLVRDIITGIFIQLENALFEGDVVTVAGVTGTVEKLSLRCVNIRDLSGTLHVTPFSEVTTVSNFMRGYGYHVAEIGIAYKENIEEAKAAMERAFNLIREGDTGGAIMDGLEMHGVTQLGDSAIVIRARIKTRPGYQWSIGRKYNEAVKAVFDAEGIDIPFPHMTLVAGVDKEGNSQLVLDPQIAKAAEAVANAPRGERAA